MKKQMTIILTEGEPDLLGNDGNVATSIQLVGENEFVTFTFGGRDGSDTDSISLDDLRAVIGRLGIDVE